MPHVFIVDVEVIPVVLVGLKVLVDILSFHALNFACSIEVVAFFVFLTELISIQHWSRVLLSKMSVFIKFELILADVLVELVIQDELMIRFEPFVTDNICRRADLTICCHLILLFEEFVLLELVEKVLECLRALNIWLNAGVLVLSSHARKRVDSSI